MTPTAEMIEAGWKAGLGLNKLQVERIVVAALAAMPANGGTRTPSHLMGVPVAEIIAATTPTAELLHGRDIRFYEPMRTLPIGTKLYANLAAPAGGDVAAIPKMRPVPIAAAKRIAKEYGYDQVLIYARRCHDTPEPHGEHMTTYGRNAQHCDVAARIGDTLKKFMGWEV